MNTTAKRNIISAFLRAKRPDLANAVADFRPGSFYDFIPKTTTMVRNLIKAMIKDRRDENEMADTLVAIIKTSLPQQLQMKVMRAMRGLMAQAPKKDEQP